VTSATAQAQPEPSAATSQHRAAKARQTFKAWRRTRPFWGGLLIFLAGFPIIYFAYAALNVSGLHVQLATTAGASAAVIGLLLIALGISVWFQPTIRIFAGIAAIVLSLISLPMANFGGFGLGLFPGLIGGALVCSWAPLKEPKAGAKQSAAADEGEEVKLNTLMAPQEESPAVALDKPSEASAEAAGEPERPSEEETPRD
jgi:Family of unknown function (DUF6114)